MSFVKYESYGQIMETLSNSMKYLACLFEENSSFWKNNEINK